MPPSIILIDKPRGLTSSQVVEGVKRKLQAKVGHTGTLDPIATGLLILLVEEATRYANLFLNLPKSYIAQGKLGEITDTFDSEGVVLETRPIDVKCDDLRNVIGTFLGSILQKPPVYSAKKVKGKRAYKLARKGKSLDLKEVKVEIYKAELIDCQLPYFEVFFEVSSGTYVRSLIHDIGIKLGCGAHLTQLRRVQVGHFHVDEAIDYESFIQSQDVSKLLIPIDKALDFLPSVELPERIWNKLKKGMQVEWKDNLENRTFLRLYFGENFVGVGLLESGLLKPYRLMPLRS